MVNSSPHLLSTFSLNAWYKSNDLLICPTLSSSVYLFVHVVICFFSFCLPIYLSVCLSICLSSHLCRYQPTFQSMSMIIFIILLKVRFYLRLFQDLSDLSKYCNISIEILLAIPQNYLTLLTVRACKYLMLNVTQLHNGINHVVRLWRLHHLKF